MPALGGGISGVWAWPSEGAQPAAPRYGLADACAYLLFGFDAARAGRRDLVHARLIGPRMKPFLIDDRPRLCVGVRFAPGFVQAAFGPPGSSVPRLLARGRLPRGPPMRATCLGRRSHTRWATTTRRI